jgi:Putative adhesin
MNLRILLTLSLILPTASALAADGNFDKTLTVNAAPTVTVSTGAGYVHVYNGADNQVHITGHVHANRNWFSSDADADARVKQIIASPPVTQSGNTITVGASHSDSDLFHNVSIDYDVTTPRTTTLKTNTGSGPIEIGGIAGTVAAGSGSGSIHVDNIGPNCRITTGSGRIQATNVHGAATLETGSGSMELTLSAPGDVKAQTGSGSIHIDGVAGALRAGTGSGSIEVAGNITDEWRLGTGSGSIRLHLAPNTHFNLNASSGSGSIHVNQPILTQGDMNRHHVTGAVNGGGPTLRASTGSGSITLE